MIECKNVSKIYPGDVPALENISFKINDKEFLSIIGSSGAGKSTLIKLLHAEEKPTSGEILFGGEDIVEYKKKQIFQHRREVGVVFQDFKLLPKKNVFENVAFAMEVSGRSEEEVAEDVPQVLEIIGLTELADKYPHEISGGEQQRVAIARALVNRPKVLIADEPTGNLDPESGWEILQSLLKINKYGTTVVLATHDREAVDKINGRVVVLKDGKIVSDEIKGKYDLKEDKVKKEEKEDRQRRTDSENQKKKSI
ncbi:MAG: cell division ATP-binding protein FtsE [Candidatus Moranbacteria bacterium]|nr:cell division ATP-binding protein FtsE [Candidatus Moranbacteria bacterium]